MPQPRASGAWESFWKNITRFQADKVSLTRGIRNTIGVVLPIAAGIVLDLVPSGLATATGAYNVSFSDADEPYPVRVRRLLAASVLVGIAVAAGGLSGRNNTVAVVMSGLWAFCAGMLVALSTQAADLGNLSLLVLVVYAAVGLSPQRALIGGALAVAGGLLEAALALWLWPVRRYVAERRALGALYVALAGVAKAAVQVLESPPASGSITDAQIALAPLATDHSTEAERYRSLLNQAERIRLALLALRRVHTRLARAHPGAAEVEVLDSYLEICATLLNKIGEVLTNGSDDTPEFLEALNELPEDFRVAAQDSPFAAMVGDARRQMDGLSGQLRSAIDMATSATAAGLASFEQRELRRPWRLRIRAPLATLRANLSFQSAAFRHAVRLAVCVALGDAVTRAFGLGRSYWVPMTIAIILKPDFSATFSRGALRFAGTFAGLLVATGLFHALPATPGTEAALIGVFVLLMRWVGPANYGLAVTCITATVVLMIAMTGVVPKQVIAARALNTVIGGAIALIAYSVWPTWERMLVPEAIASLLDAYRDYFRAIERAYLGEGGPADLESARIAARRARSNAEASVDRLSGEPGTSPELISNVSSIMASSHRLAHAMMALEAELSTSEPVPPRAEFRKFAHDVELTLYYLAAALRGSAIDRAHLPDLREDHHALVHAAHTPAVRYALVNVEADRITNSLNTVSEIVLRWVGAERM